MIPVIVGGALLLGSALWAALSDGPGAWQAGPNYQGLDTGAGRGPAALAWGALIPADARAAFRRAGERLRINPSCLTTNCKMESGFNPRSYNPRGPALGILNWTKTGRRAAQVTVDELWRMSLVEQIEGPLVRYFETVRADFGLPEWPSMLETRAACGWPASLGKPLDFVLFTERDNPRVYAANPGADLNKDGVVTKAEWFYKSIAFYNRGLRPENAAL